MNIPLIFTDTQRLALIVVTALAFLLQLIAVEYAFDRRPLRRSEAALELAVLAALFANCASLIMAQTRIAVINGAFAAFETPRAWALVATAAAAVACRTTSAFVAAACALSTLPAFAHQAWFPAAAFAAAPVMTARALFLWRTGAKRRAREVTRTSIAAALNELSDGIAFAAPGGRVLLANARMNELCAAVAGEPLRNADLFWAEAARRAVPAPEFASREDLLLRLPSGSFALSRRTVSVDGRALDELFAACVTELDAAARDLERANAELAARADTLRQTAADLESIKREQELSRLQSRIHDVAGHRIYLLQHYLERSAGLDDLDRFLPLISGLIDDLRADVTIPAPRLLDDLRQSFSFIGIALNVTGELPRDERAAAALLKIVREAATNAVRHGGATRVDVTLSRQGGECVMSVTDDGSGAPEPLVEGQGLRGIRARAAELGGSVTITTSPRFELTVRVPGAA